MNGKPPQDDLRSWLHGDMGEAAELPDLYVVGLQEMVDLNASNLVNDSLSSKRAKEWQASILATLHSKGGGDAAAPEQYVVLASEFLVGVMVLALCKRKLRPAITHVHTGIAVTGLLGVMGNKGACAVRMNVHDSSCVFVVSHLAAHRGNVEGRNADFHSIMSKLEFRDGVKRAVEVPEGGEAAAGEGGGAAAGAEHPEEGEGGAADDDASVMGGLGVADHDFIFWMGDLNYRIASHLSVPDVLSLARRCRDGDAVAYKRLWDTDQLNQMRKAKRAFAGFKEGQLRFPPTYKYTPGCSDYDDRPDKKNRAPAWCDRVLWKTSADEASSVALLYYGSTMDQLCSDHKPVHALAEVAVRITVESRRREVLQSVMAALDKQQNDSMPSVSLSSNTLDMGEVVLGVTKAAHVTLKNTGRVMAPWRFVPKLQEVALARPWIRVQPTFGMLAPGESVQVRVTVAHSVAVARAAALGRITTLDDILILRLERGRDHFLGVSASPLPSAFGCSIEQLARRPEPLRALGYPTLASSVQPAVDEGLVETHPEDDWTWSAAVVRGDLLAVGAVEGGLKRRATTSAASQAAQQALEASSSLGRGLSPTASDRKGKGVPVSLGSAAASRGMLAAPKELWRLVDALLRRGGLDARGVFLRRGEDTECAAVREALDCGTALPSGVSALALGHTLVHLLSSLREPVIPPPLFPGPDFAATHIPAYSSLLFRRLSAVRFNTLVYVLSVCREALSPSHAPRNGCTPETLAFVMSRACMRKVPFDSIGLLDGYQAPHDDTEGGVQEAGGAVLQGNWTAHMDAADPGSNWAPTDAEQGHMTAIFVHLLTSDTLSW